MNIPAHIAARVEEIAENRHVTANRAIVNPSEDGISAYETAAPFSSAWPKWHSNRVNADPRIEQASSLRNAELKHKAYRQYSPDWDHDHCAACWAKFAEWAGPDILHAGYATTAKYDGGEDYDWVCPGCYADLREIMGWKLVE